MLMRPLDLPAHRLNGNGRIGRAVLAASLVVVLGACSTAGDVAPFPELSAAPPAPAPEVMSATERDAAIEEMRHLAATNDKK